MVTAHAGGTYRFFFNHQRMFRKARFALDIRQATVPAGISLSHCGSKSWPNPATVALRASSQTAPQAFDQAADVHQQIAGDVIGVDEIAGHHSQIRALRWGFPAGAPPATHQHAPRPSLPENAALRQEAVQHTGDCCQGSTVKGALPGLKAVRHMTAPGSARRLVCQI